MGQPARERVAVYDTTLRDGTQREGICYTVDDKLRIAQHLDAFGIAFIEGGWPGSNPKDAEFFERARDMDWKIAKIAAFGSTRRAGIAPEDDPSMQALVAAETPVCTLFGKSSTLHVTEVLRTTLDENLRMIEDSIAYLRSLGRRVVYDAEHFFDGYTVDASYALETLKAAVRGGAEVLALCDTNGGSLPWRIEEVVRTVLREVQHPLGIHAHDDTGCGVANSVAAIRAGARHVQGTINGYGERCGNANLTVIMPNLEFKLGLSCVPDGHMRQLSELSLFVSEVANLSPDNHMAYVGRSAFAHKGGVHGAATVRVEQAYQHVEPALVGGTSRLVVSELGGKANAAWRVRQLGQLVTEDIDPAELSRLVKQLESEGASFEGADASFELLVRRRRPGYEPPFRIVDYTVIVERRDGANPRAEASVKVEVDGEILHTAADGNGPVNALDLALRKALAAFYPALDGVHLVDYKVRIVDGEAATGARTRVIIETGHESGTWITAGADGNIIAASLLALHDSLEYGIWRLDARPERRDERSASHAARRSPATERAGEPS